MSRLARFSKLPFYISILSGLCLLFLVSGFLGYRGVLPFKEIETNSNAIRYTLNEWIFSAPYLLRPIRYSKQGVTHFNPEEVYPGYTALQGWFSDGPQIKLIDEQGNVINQWKIDFYSIWKNPVHIYPQSHLPQTPYNFHTQGMYIFPDGSLVANVSQLGLFKMDRCGEIMWTVDRRVHHSVTMDSDGSFWLPDSRPFEEIPDEIIFKQVKKDLTKSGMRPEYDNLITHIDADGKVLGEFSVLEALMAAGIEDRLYDVLLIEPLDPTHVNDIEVVTPELAKKIDGVVSGDLLVSIRQMHMLGIFDRKTGALKWYQIGPWVRQHDPDITPYGNITVFNNRASSVNIQNRKGSNIIEFDPKTRQSKIIYPKDGNSSFVSDIMGVHQLLPNGNMLIAETRGGRVFEVDKDGEIVWEYIEHYNHRFSALFEVAERFDKNYFTVKDWNCGK